VARLSRWPAKVLESSPRLEAQYEVALRLGKTHAELLGGTPQPLSGKELAYWIAFLNRRNAARAAALTSDDED
jgi:hypothetical protein